MNFFRTGFVLVVLLYFVSEVLIELNELFSERFYTYNWQLYQDQR